MSQRYRVCIVTSTRADFGLLLPVIRAFRADTDFETQVAATGSHLVNALGYTVNELHENGVAPDFVVDSMGDDPARPVAETMAQTLTSFSALFQRERPDLIVVLGDRYEMFSVVTAAAMCRVPVAHISGGETTEGAQDEFFRHCMTKMSALHFPSTEEYRRRVVQLGEQPDTVFCAGALGVENILSVPRLSASELRDSVGFDFDRDFLLCTFHPETMSDRPLSGADELLQALDSIGMPVLFTATNADEGGADINRAVAAFCEGRDDRKLVDSLGMKRYLSAVALCAAVVGNSSSAVVEAPALGKPAVNIGDRQKGRMMADSMLCCPCERDAIEAAVRKAVSAEFRMFAAHCGSPYGGGETSTVVVREVKNALRRGIQPAKHFYDIDFEVTT